jgi:Cu/Ag efflux protein CusF
MEIELKDEKGRVTTWQVARDCAVKFTDQTAKFPNPTLKDLKAPMYIHYMFEGPVIQNIDVKEVGFDADKGGVGAEQKAVVSNLDVNVGHVEVLLNPGGTKTFEVDPKSILAGLNKGDAVTLLIEKREGKEIVTKITKNPAK